MMEMSVRPYTPADEAVWDRFVMNESGNGTFLQTRRFLNYHPAGRFADASVLVCNAKGAVMAVVPAAWQDYGGKRLFRSHPGSTYGGPVLRSTCTTAEKVLAVCGALDEYLKTCCDRAELRTTPAIFSAQPTDLLQYGLYHQGFSQYVELSTYVDIEGKNADEIMAGFDRNKKRNVRKCIEHGVTFAPITSDEEVAEFHRLLGINLSKYGVRPIHTVEDLLDFKNHRLCDEVRFYGVKEDGRFVAAGMLFYFRQTGVLHAQNLSADLSITEYSPVAFLYYNVLVEAARMGCKKLSWGISTENRGRKINLGLIESKEGYGSTYDLNRTYYKDYR